MKKTKATFVTAAVLTVASTMRPNLAHSISGETEILSLVYGPPAYLAEKCDVNMDGEINILDYCLMRNVAVDGGNSDQRYISDVNKDGIVDKFDIFSIQDYLLGKTSEIKSYEEPGTVTTITDMQAQPEYGCYITVTEETLPPVTTITDSQPQPEYGCYITVTEETQPPVTTTITRPTTSATKKCVDGHHQTTKD